MSFFGQIKTATDKIAMGVLVLSRLMTDFGLTFSSRRYFVMSARQAVLLYGAEVLAGAFRKGVYLTLLKQV